MKLNAKGLVDFKCRGNGLVLFGDDSKDANDTPINDFVLNLKNKKDTVSTTVFMIYYRRDLEEYFIQMNTKLGNDYFCFASLVYPLAIKNGMIISVFNYNFKFTINDDKTLKIDYDLENGKIITK